MGIVDMKDDCFLKMSLYAKLNLYVKLNIYEFLKSGYIQTRTLQCELLLKQRHILT